MRRNNFFNYIWKDTGAKMVLGMGVLIHLFLAFHWHEAMGQLNPYVRIGLISILDIGVTLILIVGFIASRKQK